MLAPGASPAKPAAGTRRCRSPARSSLENPPPTLPGCAGWALYFSALHSPQPGSVGGGFSSEDLPGDLQRLVPAAGCAGLAPRATIRIPYLTDLLRARSFV